MVKLCKPVYVGMTVLDLSKELMFRFYYKTLKAKYGEKVHMAYTDTDSMVLQITTDDLVADMMTLLDEYDTSNYPMDHPLQSDVNNKKVGKFKDELAGRFMGEFIALRPKMYAYIGEESGKRAKGVQRSVLKKKVTFEDYRECLLSRKPTSADMTALRSDHHHIFGQTTKKCALSPLDTKRYICADGIHTLAYGHRSIQQQQQAE